MAWNAVNAELRDVRVEHIEGKLSGLLLRSGRARVLVWMGQEAEVWPSGGDEDDEVMERKARCERRAAPAS